MTAARSNGQVHKASQRKARLYALVVGMGIGIILAWLWLLLTPPAVPIENYAVLVGAAYSRERLSTNAVERLSAAGMRDIGSSIAALSHQYRQLHPDRPHDADNLDQLAIALKGQPSTTTSGKSVGGWPGWLTVLLLAAGVASGFFVWRGRTHGKAQSSFVKIGVQDAAVGGEKREAADLAATVVMPVGEKAATLATMGGAATRRTATGGTRRQSITRTFLCTYHAGEEPFEDVHTIQHDDDTLVGACGLTAAAKLESGKPARYYAFTAWVHDYLSGEPMAAVGLLTPWASGRKGMALYDPTLTRATLLRAEKGLTATMETRNVFVQATVNDLGYGMARDVPANSYFTILSVKFEVTINGE